MVWPVLLFSYKSLSQFSADMLILKLQILRENKLNKECQGEVVKNNSVVIECKSNNLVMPKVSEKIEETLHFLIITNKSNTKNQSKK